MGRKEQPGLREAGHERQRAGEAGHGGGAIANSPLIKAAVCGRDPSWGRVTQAVGAALAGVSGPPPVVSLSFDGIDVGDEAVNEVMAKDEYEMHVGLGRGEGIAEIFFCDLTHAYVTINSDYTT